MAAGPAVAFVVATWACLAASTGLRRVARADSARGGHRGLTYRTWGGFAVVVSTAAGVLVSSGRSATAGALVGGAAALAAVAVTDARLMRIARRGAIPLAAVVAAVAGARVRIVGVAAIDVVVTAALITMVATAYRRLNHREGLLSPVSSVTAGAIALLAVDGQPAVAVASAAVAGACIGFVAFNMPPSSLFLSRAGSTFLGFVIAVLLVELQPSSGPPSGHVAVMLLVGMPLLDGVRCFTRREGSRQQGHLYVRLRRSMARGTALAVLLGSHAVLCAAAVALGRDGLLPWPPVIAVAGLAFGVLAVATRRRESPPRSPRLMWVLAGAFGAAVVLAAPAVWAGRQAAGKISEARVAVTHALDAARAGEAATAAARFEAAAGSLDRAASLLGGPWSVVARATPWVAPNLRAVHEATLAALDVVRSGILVTESVGGPALRLQEGVVPVSEIARVQPVLAAGARTTTRAVERLVAIDDGLLLPGLRSRLDSLLSEMRTAAHQAEDAAVLAGVAPAIFGANEPRHYLLAVQNPAELRGTGGIIGNVGLLAVSEGRVTLGPLARTEVLNGRASSGGVDLADVSDVYEYLARYGRFNPLGIWQNINMSPDLPTVGRVITAAYPQITGQSLHGVVVIDPVGLAALQGLTGPVRVDGWPAPIGPDNVVDVTLRQAYDAFTNERRVDFLGDVARAVWNRFVAVDLGSPPQVAAALSGAAAGGHLAFYLARPDEQAAIGRVGLTGAVKPVVSDALLVTNQNASANKVDFYLHRALRYEVTLTPGPDKSSAQIAGHVELSLRNAAPEGVTSFALGPWDERFQPGENRTFLSMYTPLALDGATIDKERRVLESGVEFDRNVYSGFVSVLAGQTAVVDAHVEGEVRLAAGGWYVLEVGRQPSLHSDAVSVDIAVPDGWRIAEVEGVERYGDGRAAAEFDLHDSVTVRVRVEPA